jgi:tetratricopeptide (TPR) repeat protein
MQRHFLYGLVWLVAGALAAPAQAQQSVPVAEDFTAATPTITKGYLYGYNRFRNKAPFAITDSVVRFFLKGARDAKQVVLSGDFSGWSTTALPMMKTDSGWIRDVKLGAGKYFYKFIVDGNWQGDADNLQHEADGYVNSIFYVTNFCFTLPGFHRAKNVYLAGSFNNWRHNELAMQRTPSGWQLPLYLPEGAYDYRFLVDGKWYRDPENKNTASDEQGKPVSVVYIGKANLSSTLSNQQSALAAARQWGNKKEIASALARLGDAYTTLSDHTNALHSFQQALRLYEDLKDTAGMANMYLNSALAYRSLSDFPHLLEYLQKARTAYEKTTDQAGLAKTLRTLGYYYINLPHLPTAADYLLKSLALYERLNNENQMAELLCDLGHTYLMLLDRSPIEDTAKAIGYLRRSLRLNRKTGNQTGIARNYWMLGEYYFRILRNIPLGLEYMQNGLRLYRQTGSKYGEVYVLINTADLYAGAPDSVLQNMGIAPAAKYHRALEYRLKALQIMKETMPESELLYPLNGLSDLYEKTGRYDSAIVYYKYYNVLREKTLNAEKQKEIVRLETMYEAQKTEDSLRVGKQLADEKLLSQLLLARQQQQQLTLSNQENELQHLAYLKTQAELQNEQWAKQQKEKQLALTEKEKALQAAQVKTLTQEQALSKLARQRQWLYTIGVVALLALASLYAVHRSRLRSLQLQSQLAQEKAAQEQKETDFQRRLADISLSALRSQMNPHFIFNCLNSIKLYTVENDTVAASEYLTKFSRLIRLVLDHSRSERITLASELTALELYIQMEAMRFKEKLQYRISVADDVETDYIEIPPLLLQPYVENAIWHGLMYKEEGCRIDVEVAVPEGGTLLEITITDNGIGRAKAAALRSKTATKHKSYGMKATSERIALINQIYKTGAQVAVHDLVDGAGEPAGTQVVLQIPLS